MPILLSLFLFVVSTPDSLEANYDPETKLGIIEANQVATHAEGYEKVFEIPEPAPVVTLPVSEGASTYRGMGSGEVEQWRSLVASQFPGDQVENGLCVIASESGGNSSAKNPNSNARGLFQIMTSVWGDYFGWAHEDFYVPELNVFAAARIWELSGWQPWSPRTRRNCGL